MQLLQNISQLHNHSQSHMWLMFSVGRADVLVGDGVNLETVLVSLSYN
jgi:hypothetical protein